MLKILSIFIENFEGKKNEKEVDKIESLRLAIFKCIFKFQCSNTSWILFSIWDRFSFLKPYPLMQKKNYKNYQEFVFSNFIHV